MDEIRYKYSSRLRSVWSSKYFDWIVTQVNDQNEMSIGLRSERRFAQELESLGINPPSPRTMKDVMKELVAENLLIRIGWGYYKVNPLIAWKGPVSQRTTAVRQLLQEGRNLNPNVDIAPQTEVLNPPPPSFSRGDAPEEARDEGNDTQQVN